MNISVRIRRLLLPTGLIVILSAAALRFLPAEGLRLYASWMAGAVLLVAAVAAIRLRTLRAFLGACALAGALAYLSLSGHALAPLVALVVICDLVLLLVVDDVYFDWQAVQWWIGLLAVQWTIVTVAARWTPETLSALRHQWSIAGSGFGALSALAVLGTLVLLLRFWFAGDPISAGLAWAAAALAYRQDGASLGVAGIALGAAALERAHWIAYHDELTGLPGRRAFNEALAALGDSYCIAVVDVDHFKKFNDSFGHDTGDQVLCKVASALAGAQHGSAFRCGGEEFAIVYADVELAEAVSSAEQVRRRIEADTFIVRGAARSQRPRQDRRARPRPGKLRRAQEVSVTVSVGIAESDSAQDPQTAMKRADRALYAAKAAGRNRVEVASRARPERRRAAAVADRG